MDTLQIISYTGVFVFAVTGVLKARTKRFDIFGAVVLAFVTAYGGGTIRDLLIGVRPVNWVNDNLALVIVVLSTIITFFFKLNTTLIKKSIFWVDAFGIGLFTIVGIQVALRAGISNGYALVMGIITATFGGLLADVLCNKVPSILKPGELYATACLLGGGLYLVMLNYHLQSETSMIISILVIASIRIFAIRKKLQLPII
ncbi:trimeric intracellular cation channel family protein [Flavobacterium amnicola]|uniref:Trimeric intracellular cation channel family protein n=1 Tax=Flavobacterium amnicola TaxID=2506422 RepID=A0A4Q1K5Q3_9FLAO|nr:trimeric intracellular cation channel family protein [Flavobacterium amnicola]RXR20957.1 trimeric intracellular cation channel family protein [Flavobacterium amnicola]